MNKIYAAGDPLNKRAEEVTEAVNDYLRAMISRDEIRMQRTGRKWLEVAEIPAWSESHLVEPVSVASEDSPEGDPDEAQAAPEDGQPMLPGLSEGRSGRRR